MSKLNKYFDLNSLTSEERERFEQTLDTGATTKDREKYANSGELVNTLVVGAIAVVALLTVNILDVNCKRSEHKSIKIEKIR
ncbi:hypothetical protein PCC6912_40310 [Chlorogloeopsis fritschii PCC 6912]|uniref:Uncharacterized protein n=1 Tax=Chlorogloeopsis fritschii PCC 6912 TaxID=211165 RepID=A0A3S1A132_CHLFR|nr:hypothetical protein [Chlorogloeopsis fritschii]RUR77072.1 hypothetical protein PCC6912_40310 [Chlorogloeopsis fritschii PCC 6912]